MYPILFTLGPFTLYAYGLMVALAFAAGTWLGGRRMPLIGQSPDLMYDAAVPILLSSLVGAKLAYLLTVGPSPVHSLGDLVGLVRGGFVFYGGFIGGVLGALVWLHRRGVPPLLFGDAAVPGFALGQAVGRLGCLLNGCCYGKPVGWGWTVPILGDGVPRHPVPLYETIAMLALMAALLRLPIRKDRPGRTLGVFTIGYAVARFAFEALRDDPRGAFTAGLSVSQWLSIMALGIGLWLVTGPSAETRRSA